VAALLGQRSGSVPRRRTARPRRSPATGARHRMVWWWSCARPADHRKRSGPSRGQGEAEGHREMLPIGGDLARPDYPNQDQMSLKCSVKMSGNVVKPSVPIVPMPPRRLGRRRESHAFRAATADDRRRSVPDVSARSEATGDPRQAGAGAGTAATASGTQAGRRAERGSGQDAQPAAEALARGGTESSAE